MKAYPEYKPSGIDWLGDIPGHWDCVKIKHITSCNDEVLSESIDGDSEIEYVEISDVSYEKGIEHSTKLKFGNAPSRARRITKSGDVIISTVRTYLKAIARIDKSEPIVSTGFAVIRPNNIDSTYLYYALSEKSFLNEIQKYSTGVSYPAITASDLVNLKIPLPPKSEQEVIAAYLDDVTGKVDALIAEKQKQVEDLRSYRTSLITETVTHGLNPDAPLRPSDIDWLGDIPEHWKITALKYLTSKIGSGITPRGGSEVYLDEGILFIRSQNVYPDGLHLEDPKYISESIDESMSNTRVYTGDILLNITGASIGRCCVYTLSELANVNQHVCIIRPLDNLINTQFLCYLLNSKMGQDQIALYQTGGNREGLNFEQLKNFAITLPPLEEQQAIADFLDEKTEKIDALINELNKQLAELAEYKKSVISEAVTGKVDVRDWTPKN